MGNSTGNPDKKNLRKQAKIIKPNKDAGICWNKKEKATRGKITVQHEEINQKVRAKEGRLQRYRQAVKLYRQNRTFQNNEEKNSGNNWGEMTRKLTNNRMQKKPNDFGKNYGNQKTQMDKQYD